ncbi:MAG: AAA domain-containing protein [Bifidobacteriaceae bacterium]|nr:AAA domain-containing protein [Bifidobacteriaceae bacterium]MCI1914858.1 AAA domain-containing protein [Bifidobacteriaceae bacterium]
MRIEIDSSTGDIALVPDEPTELRIGALQGLNIQGMEGVVKSRELVNQNPPDLWVREERSAFNRSIISTLGTDAQVTSDLNSARKNDTPSIADVWCILLQKREDNRQQFYTDLAQSIGDGEYLPEALSSLFMDSSDTVTDRTIGQSSQGEDSGVESHVLLPLPANEQQERIIKQLGVSQGVTVQGPPGTGKSHTIANLIANLLAQGKRVLVTSSKDQALEVVQEKIPAEIKDLTIAVLGSSPAAMSNLQLSARKMQDSLTNIDVSKGRLQISELLREIESLSEAERKNSLALKDALATQGKHYLLKSGESLSAGDLAQWYVKHIDSDIVPDDVVEDGVLPLSTTEFKRFAQLAGTVTPQNIRDQSAKLPNPDNLPDAGTLKQFFRDLEGYRQKVADLEELGVDVNAVDVVGNDWIRECSQELKTAEESFASLSGQWEETLAGRLRENSAMAEWITSGNDKIRVLAQKGLEIQQDSLLGHIVIVPEGEALQQSDVVDRWEERIEQGKGLPHFTDKELRIFAEQVSVDGQRPTSLAQIGLVSAQLECRELQDSIRRLSGQLYAQLGIPGNFEDESIFLDSLNVATRVEAIVEFWSVKHPRITSKLSRLTVTPYHLDNLQDFEKGIRFLRLSEERNAERDLTKRVNAIEHLLQKESKESAASRVYADFLSAIQMRDADKWEVALSAVKSEKESQRDTQVLLGYKQRMERSGCEKWAAEIIKSGGVSAAPTEVENIETSWEVAKVRTWLKNLNAGPSIQTLMKDADEISRRKRENVISVVDLSARINLKQSITDSQRRALNIWLQAIGRVGRGTGKQAPRFMAQAKAVLPQAMGAVPVWIMPIYRVLQNFDPRTSQPFDVIIVDESSQCDLLSVGVLALARKAIVVGDDKQTSPESVGVPTDKIADLQNQYLKDFPGKAMFTVDASLYSLAETAFRSTVLLREHFRCVPEIIKFSNRFYNNEIVPLRETKYPKIGNALHAVYVNSPSLKRGSSRINRGEAKAIAAQIRSCIDDPRYEGLTFGVVSFRSGLQSEIIENELRAVLSIQELESRKIRVGNPPDFQGDERSVMFLSLVSDDSSFAATSKRYAQWSNVAVSRAQEQLWVYYSMDPLTLRPEDYSRQIVEYVKDTHAEANSEDLFALTESKFERDFLKMLLARGYQVTPQFRVGDYRLDFVVTVAEGYRLAIECDGDRYHGLDKWDADVRRQRVLERLKWEFWRIRASEFYLDRESSTKSLWDRLEAMKEEASSRNIVLPGAQAAALPVVSTQSIETVSEASEEENFEVSEDLSNIDTERPDTYNFPVFKRISEDDFYPQKVTQFRGDWIDTNVKMLVDREYPLHVERACQLLLPLLHANRVSSTIRKELKRSLSSLRDQIRIKDNFLYPAGVSDPQVRIPNPRTNIEHISVEELALAMLTIESFMDGCPTEDLIRETAKEYGFSRLGSKVRDAMAAALTMNVKNGKLRIDKAEVFAAF